MKFYRLNICLLFAVMLTIGCGGTQANNSNSKDSNDKSMVSSKKREVVMAKLYDYRVVREYPHSTKSYTQGLQYVDGVMWEGTGREGSSYLQTIDLKTGEVNILASLPNSEFGEGITHYKDLIYQLTWESHKAYLYDSKGNFIKNITYRGEGWGITTDGEHLYMSDGSSTIRRINPETFATEESICVTLNGEPLDLLNELEWIDGHIWANVYLTDAIVEIDPKTGIVVGFIDLPELRGRLKQNPEAEALNGIAYNASTGNFYVAGKDWNRIFEIEVIK
ncbi:MAG: glutaminyl-peptide cyclotransferase [Alistipes sp.]|nr:glutaminyl-peptide cyclotransferase [Alistipes sp.]